MKILAIYDNGGKTLDRYTVVTDQQNFTGLDMLGLSEGGHGYSQWSVGTYAEGRNNRHLGKRVNFEHLTAETQSHIARRLFGEE